MKKTTLRLSGTDASRILTTCPSGPGRRFSFGPPTATSVPPGARTRLYADRGAVARDLEDQVVPTIAPGEVVAHVVDDLVGSERAASSTLPALQTPVASSPNAFASWTASVPTPPEAPFTSTLLPLPNAPLSRSACSAVTAAIGPAAASSKFEVDRLLRDSRRERRRTRRARRSARRRPRRPAASRRRPCRPPRLCRRSRRRARAASAGAARMPDGRRRACPASRTSAGFTEAARTRTSTPSSTRSGLSVSSDPEHLGHAEAVVDDGLRRVAPSSVSTTLPTFCPVSTYRVASTTSSSG